MKKIAITLTEKQWSDLSFYLTQSTNYRLREIETCKELAKEIDKETGKKVFPKMASNAEFYEKLHKSIEEICESIDKQRME